MFNTKYSLLCFLSYFVLQSSSEYITFVKLCKKDDNACVKSTAQATVPYVADGIPSLGLRPADPLDINEISYSDANLKMIFTNNHITGPKNCKISDAEYIDKGNIKVVLETPLNMTGQYDLRGKLLFLEALGNGDYFLQTDNVILKISAILKTIEKDGHKFWKPTKVDYTYDLVEKVHIRLENLFGGDKVAAEPVAKLFDEQWKEVIAAFGGPLIEKIISEYVKIIEEFLLNLPIEEVAN